MADLLNEESLNEINKVLENQLALLKQELCDYKEAVSGMDDDIEYLRIELSKKMDEIRSYKETILKLEEEIKSLKDGPGYWTPEQVAVWIRKEDWVIE